MTIKRSLNLMSEKNYEKIVFLLMKNWALFREIMVIPSDVCQAELPELACSTLKKSWNHLKFTFHSTLSQIKSAFKISVKFYLSVMVLQ